MDAKDCIISRKSSRKFLDDEVPRGIVEQVILDAQRAPSYRNSQPWEVTAVRGLKKKRLSEMLLGLLAAGEATNPDIPEPPPWPSYILDRMKDTAEKRAKAYGIVPGDPAAMRKSKEANFAFYGAPLVLFFYQDSELGTWSILDMGMFVQNVILGFHDRGISCVPQAFLVDYPAHIKQALGIGSNKKLVLGMSAGFADSSDVRSQFASPRANLDEVFRWVE